MCASRSSRRSKEHRAQGRAGDPLDPPANWASLSPTGLIPAMQDGDFSVAESSAICAYLDRKEPRPSILPAEDKDYSRAMFWDGYAGWMFRSLVQGLFFQKVINPVIFKGTTDQRIVDTLLAEQRPKIFGYLELQITGNIWSAARSASPISPSSRIWSTTIISASASTPPTIRNSQNIRKAFWGSIPSARRSPQKRRMSSSWGSIANSCRERKIRRSEGPAALVFPVFGFVWPL